MRFYILSCLTAILFASSISAITAQKAVIVTYPDETPNSVLNEAMDAIREAGGVITHEYTLLKGFAAKASAKTLETVHTLSEEWKATIEEDQIVSIDGDIINGHTN